MPSESYYTAALLAEIRRQAPHLYVQKLSVPYAHGVPDFVIVGRRRSVWVEAKLEDRLLTEHQRVTLGRLSYLDPHSAFVVRYWPDGGLSLNVAAPRGRLTRAEMAEALISYADGSVSD